MIRVLHVLPKTPVGGVGAFLKNTQTSIDKKIIFDYLIIEDVRDSNFIEFVKERGSRVYLLNEKLKLRNYYRIKSKINEVLENNSIYNIVHLHSANIVSLVFPICKKNNIKIRIVHSHSTKYSDNFLKSIRNFLLEIPMFYYATNFIACSNASGKFLFKKRNYEIVYNGVSIPNLNIEERTKESDKIILGNVGNFVPTKNHSFLIKLLKKLCENNNNYELWLFGDGKLINKIKEMVAKYGLENKVVFYGRVNNIHEYYKDIDVLLLPSKYEGFPVVAMEAQSYGIPIIASENVTKEIDFFEDTKFIKTRKKDIDNWIAEITTLNFENKRKKIEMFKSSKFTIKETTKTLEKAYIEYMEGERL